VIVAELDARGQGSAVNILADGVWLKGFRLMIPGIWRWTGWEMAPVRSIFSGNLFFQKAINTLKKAQARVL
jgi:hypothetical protein